MKHVHISETNTPGVLEIVASGWDGRILKMTRDAYFELRKSNGDRRAATSGTYILFGSYFDRSDEECRKLYVGKTQDVWQRGEQHEREKSFWTDALVFTSSGPWMNSAHAGVLEAEFIAWVREANRYTVTNDTNGGVEQLGPGDTAILDLFKREVRSVARMAGIDVFEPDPLGLYILKRKRNYPGAPACDAKGRLAGKALIVLAGSTLPTPAPDEAGFEFLDALVTDGRVTRAGGVIQVNLDTCIPIVGSAMKILGSHSHEWSTASRTTLSSVYRKLLSDEDVEPSSDGRGTPN